jgi:hypothetical protein
MEALTSNYNASSVGPGILHQLETLIQQNRKLTRKVATYEEQIKSLRGVLKELKEEFPQARYYTYRALQCFEVY